MRLHRSFSLASMASLMLVASAQAQDYYQPEQNYYPASNYYGQLFSAEELDNLVAPVALYPDALLAQIFIAATFADQVDIAARHVRMFGRDNIDYQPWDVSVRSVAHYPPVLNMLADRTDWTAALGQAYAVQSEDLMDAVQRLRRMARYHGNLASSDYHTVIVEREIIRIVPSHPRVIYVPVYEPHVIYHRRVGFTFGIHTPHWSFGVSFPIGSWLSYDCDWGLRRVYYDGWRGRGWRERSRPYIQVVNNIYINNRYETVNINRTIVNRTVNHVNLNVNNTVHNKVKFDGYARNIARVAQVEKQSSARVAQQRVAPARSSAVVSERNTPQVQSRAQQSAPQTTRSQAPGRTQPSVAQRSQPGVLGRTTQGNTVEKAKPQVMARPQQQSTAQRSVPPGQARVQQSQPQQARVQQSQPQQARVQQSPPARVQQTAPSRTQSSAAMGRQQPQVSRAQQPQVARSQPQVTRQSAPPASQSRAATPQQAKVKPQSGGSASSGQQRVAPGRDKSSNGNGRKG